MDRILRGERGWGIFPRMGLFSVAIGGFGGYCIGYLSAAKDERTLLKKERIVELLRRHADEYERELKLHEKKIDEFVRSLRDLKVAADQQVQTERALRKFEAQLVQRERKVRTSEEKLS